MTLFGYARVSTTDQDIAIQVAALKAAGCQTIRSEKKSGSERGSRTELQILLDFLREGYTLVVTRIDRLARSMKDLQDIVHELKGRGVALKATEQPIDTGTAAGKAFLDQPTRAWSVVKSPPQELLRSRRRRLPLEFVLLSPIASHVHFPPKLPPDC